MKHFANDLNLGHFTRNLPYLLYNEVFEQNGDIEEMELKRSIDVKSLSIAGKIASLKKEIGDTKETIQKAIVLEKLDALE